MEVQKLQRHSVVKDEEKKMISAILRTILYVLLVLLFLPEYSHAEQKHSFKDSTVNIKYGNDGDIHIYDFEAIAKKEDIKTSSPHLGLWLTGVKASKLPSNIGQRFYHIAPTEREAGLLKIDYPEKIEPGSPYDLLAKGYAAYQAFSFDAALVFYNSFITKYPEHPLVPYALYSSGQCLCLLHKYNESIAVNKLIAKKYSDSPWAAESLYRIGCITAGQLEKVVEGEKIFSELVRLYPKMDVAADALFMMAAINIATSDKAQAKKIMQLIVQNFPNSLRAKVAAEYLNSSN